MSVISDYNYGWYPGQHVRERTGWYPGKVIAESATAHSIENFEKGLVKHAPLIAIMGTVGMLAFAYFSYKRGR